MSFKMERYGNTRIRDEKCTKLIPKESNGVVALEEFHTKSNYDVAHTSELRRSFIKALKGHVLHGNYGVTPNLRPCRSWIEAINTSPNSAYFVILSTRDSQVTTRASLEGIFQFQPPSF
nr:hypothetical protein [Tanacetum cinerariifolium]